MTTLMTMMIMMNMVMLMMMYHPTVRWTLKCVPTLHIYDVPPSTLSCQIDLSRVFFLLCVLFIEGPFRPTHTENRILEDVSIRPTKD